ncbi:gem-associated protein 7-like [Salvelinus fontinalis]|uniref:gem-associated protein 7-like n=1 Tax=Salvelinus fontinalis TaxID=8038 RepID=UPI0024859B5E|nr:gem-associated protein 7-like [Salvelinus fontinalis]XP_055735507.1 gem-associated protein 7-like [Salvelinus fontinalis]XP_055735508.1 gem-associated protein 7-like [Salvelinus fontinalis]
MRPHVSVLRLPRGPAPNGRGFDPNSPRFIALCPTTISASTETGTDSVQIREEQRARSALRESFLRTLIAMTNKQVQFHMYERVEVEAKFGASDIDVLNFQILELHTPIGVQKEALLRCQDVISYSFDL